MYGELDVDTDSDAVIESCGVNDIAALAESVPVSEFEAVQLGSALIVPTIDCVGEIVFDSDIVRAAVLVEFAVAVGVSEVSGVTDEKLDLLISVEAEAEGVVEREKLELFVAKPENELIGVIDAMDVTDIDAVRRAEDVIVGVKESVFVSVIEPLSRILDEAERDALELNVSDTVPDSLDAGDCEADINAELDIVVVTDIVFVTLVNAE